MKPNHLLNDQSLKQALKDKSRSRRHGLERLAAPSASARPPRNDVLPSLELVRIAPEDLRLLPRRVRKLDPAHVREIAASVSALGFCDPILAGKNNMVLDGEARVEAAKLLGLPKIPCICIGHLSEAEQRTLRLAINRLGEKGSWDIGELKIEFEELIVVDAPIEIAASPSTKSIRSFWTMAWMAPKADRSHPSPEQSRSQKSATSSCSATIGSFAAMRPSHPSLTGSWRAPPRPASFSPMSLTTCRSRAMSPTAITGNSRWPQAK